METTTRQTPSMPKTEKKRVFKNVDEAAAAKAEEMEKLFANADWNTFKRPIAK